MKTYITAEQYFAAYADNLALTDEIRASADAMLAKVNAQMEVMEGRGVVFGTNTHTGTPHFGTHISGEGNGGWRPPACTVGAAHSHHKMGKAVDICDPLGALDADLDANPGELKANGMAREAPGSTIGWCHMQDGLPPSGNETFLP